jgi:hypothetical protein
MFYKTIMDDIAQQSITVTEIVRYASRHIKTEAIELLVRRSGAKLSVTSILSNKFLFQLSAMEKESCFEEEIESASRNIKEKSFLNNELTTTHTHDQFAVGSDFQAAEQDDDASDEENDEQDDGDSHEHDADDHVRIDVAESLEDGETESEN